MTAIGKSGRSETDFRKIVIERPVYTGDLNRSMQHLDSHYREGGVENEAAT